MAFQRGHAKVGGRKAGVPNRKTMVHREAMQRACERIGLPVERLSEVSPLQGMLICLQIALEAGDHAGVLAGASAAAPYCHPRLSSSDVRVQHSLADRTDAELAEEMRELETKMRAVGLVIDGEAEPVPQTH